MKYGRDVRTYREVDRENGCGDRQAERQREGNRRDRTPRTAGKTI
jgi:hypothetical protein